jgi:hypothetical protein
MAKQTYSFHEIESRKNPLYEVSVADLDGQQRVIGTVRDFYISHMGRRGWEATGLAGDHRAVHEHRWQAVWALTWNGSGYPFPVPASKRREIEG